MSDNRRAWGSYHAQATAMEEAARLAYAVAVATKQPVLEAWYASARAALFMRHREHELYSLALSALKMYFMGVNYGASDAEASALMAREAVKGNPTT